MENRSIKKRLYEIALKEYKDKRPSEIVCYRVKKAVILQRGYGPSIILSGLKGQVVPFLLLANYGAHFRLYYLLENGSLISAINIPKLDFERESLKFQKATSKIFQIPKPELPEKKVEKLKKQFNEKFQNFIALVEKQTSCKVKYVPIITLYQPSVGDKAIIKREHDFIKYPTDLITHPLLDGFLARDAYRLIIPSFIKKTAHAKLFTVAGAYFQIPKSLKSDWIHYWESKISLKTKIAQLKEDLLNHFLQFLCYLGRFESEQFSESQIERIFSDFPETHKKQQSNAEIAAQCFLNMANHEGIYIIKAALFYMIANEFKQSKKVLSELSKFTQTDTVEAVRIRSEYLANFQLSKIFTKPFQFEFISTDVRELFQVALENVKNQVIEIKRIHRSETPLSKPVNIKIKIKNKSDILLKSLKIVDNLPKKSQLELLNSNTFSLPQLEPQKELTLEYQILSIISQKISFKTGNLVFEDEFGNHYAQSIPTTKLIVK